MQKTVTIGSLTLKNRVFLAPMAGVTNLSIGGQYRFPERQRTANLWLAYSLRLLAESFFVTSPFSFLILVASDVSRIQHCPGVSES